jgi:hypothetical protein
MFFLFYPLKVEQLTIPIHKRFSLFIIFLSLQTSFMTTYCLDNLMQIKALVSCISNETYKKPCKHLFKSSIGQHIRHALEFYKCLLEGIENGVVNYDERRRDHELEISTAKAEKLVIYLELQLKSIKHNLPLKIKANYTNENIGNICLSSSLYRELSFCLEHSIHHLAFVKTGLQELDCLKLIDKDFGIAPSTLRHHKQCVQ